MRKLPIAVFVAICAGPLLADVRVQFVEGAPKDTFIVTNEGTCAIGPAKLVIDFAETSAGLIFDVTELGAGVKVFQPFEIAEGAEFLDGLPTISDGDQAATLLIDSLGSAQKIAFTIDVDDTKSSREITVSDDEINGTRVSLTSSGKQQVVVLGANSEVRLATDDCMS